MLCNMLLHVVKCCIHVVSMLFTCYVHVVFSLLHVVTCCYMFICITFLYIYHIVTYFPASVLSEFTFRIYVCLYVFTLLLHDFYIKHRPDWFIVDIKASIDLSRNELSTVVRCSYTCPTPKREQSMLVQCRRSETVHISGFPIKQVKRYMMFAMSILPNVKCSIAFHPQDNWFLRDAALRCIPCNS